MTTDPAPPAAPGMTARCPEDLLAAVPVVLGFHPADSLVMMCCRSRRPGDPQFHARVDLPPPHRLDRIGGSVDPLRAAAQAHRVEQVAFIVYTRHRRLARAVSRALEAAFADVGLQVVLRAHDGRWSRLAGGVEGPRVAYDTGLHDFALRAVVEGTVVLRDRAALAATLARDPAACAEVVAELMALPAYGPDGPPADEVDWAVALVDAATATGRAGPRDVARLVRLVAHPAPRERVWRRLARERAHDLVPWWSDVVRRTPDALLPDAGFLLAFTAWLSGHGALTWCALDRVFAVAPDHSAARLVAALVEAAVAPTTWEEMPQVP